MRVMTFRKRLLNDSNERMMIMKKILKVFLIFTICVAGFVYYANIDRFKGSWQAIEIREDGSEFVWAEVLLFEEDNELYVHSNFVAEKSGNPLEKNLYAIDNLKKELTIITLFGMSENYKYKFIDKDTFTLDKEFINLQFIRIDQNEVDKYLKQEI